MDEEGHHVAAGNTVSLVTTLFDEDFALRQAHVWGKHHGGHWLGCLAVGGSDADAIFVPQESFLAEAPDDAVPGADGAWMWIGAGGRACSAAGVEDFILWALWLGEGGWGLALFFGDALAMGTSSEMSLLACATRDADEWANWVGFIAGAVTALALTVFFIVTAHLDFALVGWHAQAFAVLQVSWLAEATNDALESADWAWIGVGTGRMTGGSTGQEHFVGCTVVLWESEQHGCFRDLALIGWHADTLGTSQMTLLAEASNHTVLGADRAWMWISAGWGAGGSTSLELFIVWASWEGNSRWNLHVEVWDVATFFQAHAFAVVVLQESFLTETAGDTLEGTDGAGMHGEDIGARGSTGRTAFAELCI